MARAPATALVGLVLAAGLARAAAQETTQAAATTQAPKDPFGEAGTDLDAWGPERWLALILPPVVAGLGLLALSRVHRVATESKRLAVERKGLAQASNARQSRFVAQPNADGPDDSKFLSTMNPAYNESDGDPDTSVPQLRQVKSMPQGAEGGAR